MIGESKVIPRADKGATSGPSRTPRTDSLRNVIFEKRNQLDNPKYIRRVTLQAEARYQTGFVETVRNW